jgi:endonuclease/exonuclease/phosphatase family metal-dependent hydrolase
MNITLLQWNTWYKEDINNKISLLKQINADIYCLQELNETKNEFNQIRNELNLNGYLGLTKTDHGGQGNAIFTKYPITTSYSTFIKQPKEHRKSFSDEGRIYIETEIQIDDKTLVIGTTHISYTDSFKETKEKEKESKILLDILNKHKKSYIFSGDLNVTEDSKLIKTLEKDFINAGPEYIEKTWTTKDFDYNGFKVTDLEYRLDYIFTTQDIKIINSEIINTDYSDHLPILTEIKI